MIAHSHGGNVAWLALGADDVLAQRVKLVCLSTPFLEAAGRRAAVRTQPWRQREAAPGSRWCSRWRQTPCGRCSVSSQPAGRTNRREMVEGVRERVPAAASLGAHARRPTVLVIKSSSDVASLALGAAQTASWASGVATRVVTTLCQGPARPGVSEPVRDDWGRSSGNGCSGQP